MYYRSRKAQSTLEYVILIGFVVAALIAMGAYMKRGVQGKLRESTDQVGEQYEAGNTTAEYTTYNRQVQTENMTKGGVTTTTIAEGDSIQTKKDIAPETVGAWDSK